MHHPLAWLHRGLWKLHAFTEIQFQRQLPTYTLVNLSADAGDKKSAADTQDSSDAAAGKIDGDDKTAAPKENEHKEHESLKSGSDQKGKEESDNVDGAKKIVESKGGNSLDEQQSIVRTTANEENAASSDTSDGEISGKRSDPEKGNDRSYKLFGRTHRDNRHGMCTFPIKKMNDLF